MEKFEVGKAYHCMDFNMATITVIKRTEKMVTVVNNESGCTWKMKIKNDGESEYVTDSCVPSHWRQLFTYYADRAEERM